MYRMRKTFTVCMTVVLVSGGFFSFPGTAGAAFGDTSTFLGKSYTGDGGDALLAYLDMPQAYALASDGSFYVADTFNTVIRKIDASNVITTYAGTGEYGSTDGHRTSTAQFSEPEGIALDGSGYLYVADTGQSKIRKIVGDTVSTLSVTGATALKTPRGLLVSGSTLYIADAGNGRVVSVPTAGGALTEVATGLSSPLKLALNGTDLYVVDFAASTIVKIDLSTGTKTTFASGFTEPRSIAIYGSNVYVSAGENGVWNEIWSVPLATGVPTRLAIRRETTILNNTADMVIKVVSGTPYIYQLHGGGSTVWRFNIDGSNEVQIAGKNRFGDEAGVRANALLGRPQELAMAAGGTKLYIVYAQGNKIAEYSFITDEVTVLAGFLRDSYVEGTGEAVRMSDVVSIAVSPDGKTIYLADRNNNRIRTLDIETKTTAYLTGAGIVNATGTTNNGYQEGGPCAGEEGALVSGCAYFNRPTGLALTADGATLYVADGSNNRIRKVNVATGQTSFVAGGSSTGLVNGTGSAAKFNGPFTVALSSDEKTLYVADKNNHAIRAVNLTTNAVTTLVGTGSIGYREGAFSSAVLAIPENIELGPDGNLYVSEAGSLRVRKLDLTKKETSLVSGSGNRGKVDGAATVAEWNAPKGMAFSGKSLLVADFRNDLIRSIDLANTVPSADLDRVMPGKQFMGYSPKLRGGYFVDVGDVVAGGKSEIVMGTGQGFGPHVQVFDADGTLYGSFFAYHKDFRGGVQVGVGDVNGDGVDDIVTVPGPGGRPEVKIWDRNGALIAPSFYALNGQFTGGAFIAVGNVTGDATDEILIAAAKGGGAQVTVHNADGKVLANFFAYDKSFRGGITVATVDTDGDGTDEMVTGTHFGAPHIQTFKITPGLVKRLNPGFYAFGANFRGGVSVTGADVDGDGSEEIIVGVGEGAEPHIKIYNKQGNRVIREFRPYARQVTGGVVIAGGDVTGDDKDEVVVVPRTKGGPQVRIIEF